MASNQSPQPEGSKPNATASARSSGRRTARWRICRWWLVGVGLTIVAIGALLPQLLPRVLTIVRDDLIVRGPTEDRKVFLTVDDGPSEATHKILAVLAKHRVRATFFITGNRVRDPAQLTMIRAERHDLAHHMETTQACSKLSLDEFKRDFDEVDRLLQTVGGVRLFRPPSDFGTRDQIAYAKSRGYDAVVGTVYPLDHWLENTGMIRRLAAWLVSEGGILILHDGADRGPRTAEVLDQLIPQLKRRGYAFGELATELGVAKDTK